MATHTTTLRALLLAVLLLFTACGGNMTENKMAFVEPYKITVDWFSDDLKDTSGMAPKITLNSTSTTHAILVSGTVDGIEYGKSFFRAYFDMGQYEHIINKDTISKEKQSVAYFYIAGGYIVGKIYEVKILEGSGYGWIDATLLHDSGIINKSFSTYSFDSSSYDVSFIGMYGSQLIEIGKILYQALDYISPYVKNMYYPVGSHVSWYDTSTDTVKFYKKIKEDGYNSNLAMFTQITKNTKIGTNFVWGEPPYVSTSTSSKFTIMLTTEPNGVGGLSYLQVVATYWDGITLPISDASSNIVLKVGDAFYYYNRSENTEYQNGRANNEFFYGRELDDSEYWELLDSSQIWQEISATNQYKCVDEALDTQTYMPNGGEYIFNIDGKCDFDFVGLSNCKTSGYKIEFLDASNNSAYPTIDESVATGTQISIFDCCTNEQNMCLIPIYKEFPYSLSQYLPTTTRIKITFDGETWLGAVFAGRRLELPCISKDMSVKTVRAGKQLINDLSGLALISKNTTNLLLKETTISMRMKSDIEAANYTRRIDSYIWRLVYFDTTFIDANSQTDTTYSYLAHSGTIMYSNFNPLSGVYTCVLQQFNNAS